MLQAGLASFRNDPVNRFGTDEFNVGARGIKVRVVGNHVALLAGNTEQDSLGRSRLVSRDDVLVPDDVLNRIAKAIEASAARIALIALT
jgi:hypothetical protein